MTENKRFTFKHYDWLQWHIFDNEEYLCEVTFDGGAQRLIDLLNELNNENGQLKMQLQSTSDQRDEFHCGARENANRVGKLEKENKELKEKNEQLRFGLKKIKGVLHSLEDENKNLKVTIEAREVLIDVCEKKFRELGYIITVDDDGYVIE